MEFRSGGLTEIDVDVINGEHACFSLSYACEEPESVKVHIDSALAMQWHRPNELGPGESLGLAPSSYCHHTYELGSGLHDFALTAVCGGTPTSDSVNASTTPPDFRIGRLIADQSSYAAGDTLTLELDAGVDGLTVQGSFALLDSAYTTGSETVTPLGGGLYEIEYTISTSNQEELGEKPVGVVVSNGSRNKSHFLIIRYLLMATPAPASRQVSSTPQTSRTTPSTRAP